MWITERQWEENLPCAPLYPYWFYETIDRSNRNVSYCVGPRRRFISSFSLDAQNQLHFFGMVAVKSSESLPPL